MTASDRIVTRTVCEICPWESGSEPTTMQEATDMGSEDGWQWVRHSQATGHLVLTIEAFDPDQDMTLIMSATLSSSAMSKAIRPYLA